MIMSVAGGRDGTGAPTIAPLRQVSQALADAGACLRYLLASTASLDSSRAVRRSAAAVSSIGTAVE